MCWQPIELEGNRLQKRYLFASILQLRRLLERPLLSRRFSMAACRSGRSGISHCDNLSNQLRSTPLASQIIHNCHRITVLRVK
jgi:hypothetical protein